MSIFSNNRLINICVMDDWTKSLNEGIPVDIIYMDYMKAFDKVSHRHLLHKLENFGIHHHILNWIKDFLCRNVDRPCL